MNNSKYISAKISLLVLTLTLFAVVFLLAKSMTVVSATALSCLGDIPSDSDLLVNITEGVTNDADSGENGNYWAMDNYTRHIKVWQLFSSDGVFCADVRYDGTFDVQPGVESPGIDLATLTGDEDGVMTGGRRAQIGGELLSEPLWLTNGDVGSFNYKCDLDGNCPGFIKWQDQYFQEEYQYSDSNWAWTYTSCGHGQWINSSDGSSGDIVVGPTDEVCTQPIPDICTNIEGIQTSIPDGYHKDSEDGACNQYQLGGAPPPSDGVVLGASTGKVLGASTMAGTGSFTENLYMAIMGLGAIITAAGAKNLKKASAIK